jgi:POT family proton-dependent oligopeptide transporter
MVIFFTEMWERFGFYILIAIFVLYMDNEFDWSDAKKGDFYGWFLGAVYFIPVLGGWFGDKLFGQIRTIILGAILMIFGYVALASSSPTRLIFFYLGLILVAFGTGIFKVNMSVLVGNLYRDRTELKDAGFNIYYMGVNVGAALAPLAATVIGNVFHSYRISFWAAAIGMTLSLIIFQIGKKSLKRADIKQADTEQVPNKIEPDYREMSKAEERARIVTLVTLFTIVIFFWIGFYQNGFALTLFAQRSTIRSDILRPETYQFFNPFFILVLTPFLLSYFKRLAIKGKEPSTPAKIFMGMLIMASSMIIMVFASLSGGNLDQNIMSPSWLISTYFFVTLAEILISPMGQSFVSKVSPPRIQGLMMGFWFSATAMGSYGSGLIGKFYSDFEHHHYFLLLFGLLIFSGILVLISFRRLKRFAE